MRKFLSCLAAGLLAAAAPAKADWVDRAWSDESVRANGDPAVTLGEDGVLLVLPEATLREAYAAGLDTKAAVRLFLGRWGPRCSDVIDLDRDQKNLKVQLFLQHPVALEDVSGAVQSEILDTLLALKKAAARSAGRGGKAKLPPRAESVFVVSEDHLDVIIDYIAQGKATCTQPGLDENVS